MHSKKHYHVDEERLERGFGDYRSTLKAIRQAADKNTRTMVIYGNQIIRVE